MQDSRRKLKILACIVLVASILVCIFGLWLIISRFQQFAALKASGQGAREATAPLITDIAEGAVLAIHYFFVARFFLHSLKNGVPFTHEGAKEVKILGFETILLPIVAWIVSCIAYSGIQSPIMVLQISVYEIVLGIALIIMSYVIEYGTNRIERSHRGHQELQYISEHNPEVLSEARIAIFGTDKKEEENGDGS